MKSLLRRRFLKFGAMVAAVGVAPDLARAVTENSERRLSLYSTHTGEKLDVVYRIGDKYIAESLAQIDHVLRDHRNNEVHAMRPDLLDLLHNLSGNLDSHAAFHVISGYRSPVTNAILSAQSEGVAKHSLHMDGLAIDIRLPGRDLADLRRAAVALKCGGVGHYPRLDFVHLDVGRVRYW